MRVRRAALAGVVLLTLAGCTDIAAAASAPSSVTVEVPAQNPTPYWEWHQTYAHRLPFLVCTRLHETPGRRIHPYDDGYTYPSTNGFLWAYQFTRSTWAGAVSRAGYSFLALAKTPPPMKYQDLAAIQLARERGAQPWGGRCSQHLWRQPNGVWAFR